MSTPKAAMDSGGTASATRRRGTAPPAGSVWESRMKLDQVKGGIKVFDATHHIPLTTPHMDNNHTVNPKQSILGISGKRKTWKSDNPEATPNPIIQIAKQSQRSESPRILDQQFKEIDVCADDVKKSRSGEEEAGDSDLKKTPSDGNSLDQLVGPVEKKAPEGSKSSSNSDDPNKPRSDDQHCEEKKTVSGNVGRRIKTPSDGGEVDEQGKEIEIKKINSQQKKLQKFAVEEKKLNHSSGKPVPPISASHSRVQSIPSKTNPNNNNFHGIPRSNGKLQSFVDLVMWRDVSKSAFVFGIGTFAIVSSSFTGDLNISFISVVSYLGLVYLAANFLFRSLINRGSSMEMNGSDEYVVGEEEAIWVIKLFLPYVNEFLVKLRALFSGDPATTMKLAVLLFVLAQCGNSITIWKMAKLGFFGVFMVPKVCSSYSSQITAYGTFWIHRFRDAWKSCSHKKLLGFAIFTLVWNLASIVSRIWIVFMLFVGLKYYQQSCTSISDGCASEETTGTESCSQQQQQHIGGLRRNGGGSTASAAYTRTQKESVLKLRLRTVEQAYIEK